MRLPCPRIPVVLWLTILLPLVCVAAGGDDEGAVLTSVFAKTDKGYKRQKDPDGRWVREYYAMTNGGPAESTIQDNAQDRVRFVALATVLAEHLARQGYFPATDPQKVDLLLVVNWGRTTPFNDTLYRTGADSVLASINNLAGLSRAADAQPQPAATDANSAPQTEVTATGTVDDMQRQAAESQFEGAMLTQQMFNRARDEANARNARLLGYMGDINKSDGIQRFAGGGNRYDELLADIEEARYYIIVSAYDFKKTVREKKPRLQWVTRMSMRAPGNSFAEKAASMVAYSASRFGQNTDGLERKAQPEFKVNLEDLKFLGVADTPPPPPAETKAGEK